MIRKDEDIKRRVESTINEVNNTKVLASVIMHFAEPILEKRKNMIVSAMEEIDKLEKELVSFKPDINEWNADSKDGKPNGTITAARYSEGHYWKYKATLGRKDGLLKALELALPDDKTKGVKPDYRSLEDLVGKKKSDKKPPTEVNN